MTLNEEYWTQVREWAKINNSDGCTFVNEWLQDCCFEHDMHLVTGRTLRGRPIPRYESDFVYRH